MTTFNEITSHYGDYTLTALEKGTELRGIVIQHKRNCRGQLRTGVGSHKRIFFEQFSTDCNRVMCYLQLWAQQHRMGNLQEGEPLPGSLLQQVVLMAEGEN